MDSKAKMFAKALKKNLRLQRVGPVMRRYVAMQWSLCMISLRSGPNVVAEVSFQTHLEQQLGCSRSRPDVAMQSGHMGHSVLATLKLVVFTWDSSAMSLQHCKPCCTVTMLVPPPPPPPPLPPPLQVAVLHSSLERSEIGDCSGY
jgi:hypothetical protein